MPIIRWRPFSDLEDFFEDFPVRTNSWDLAVDVSEDENSITVEMHIPGINPDKIDVKVEDDHLHISGSREQKKETEDRHYYHKEIRRGSFERRITLPTPVIHDSAHATFKDGVLIVTLSKKKDAGGTKVNVTRG